MSVNSLFKPNDYQIFIGNDQMADQRYQYPLYIDVATGSIGIRNPAAYASAAVAVAQLIPANVKTIIGPVVNSAGAPITIVAGTGVTPALTVHPYQIRATINYTNGTPGDVIGLQFSLSANLNVSVLSTTFVVSATGSGTAVLEGITPNLTVATYAFSIIPTVLNTITVGVGSIIALQLTLP